MFTLLLLNILIYDLIEYMAYQIPHQCRFLEENLLMKFCYVRDKFMNNYNHAQTNYEHIS